MIHLALDRNTEHFRDVRSCGVTRGSRAEEAFGARKAQGSARRLGLKERPLFRRALWDVINIKSP